LHPTGTEGVDARANSWIPALILSILPLMSPILGAIPSILPLIPCVARDLVGRDSFGSPTR